MFVLLLLCITQPILAEAPRFETGERVLFFGDSIFHGGQVHADVLLFYATRYPDQPISMVNAGVAGDMTQHAVRRIAWDVEAYHPTTVVMMFGMNDVGRWLYGEGNDSPAVLQQRSNMMQAHENGLDQLLDDLKAMDAKVILCTPTPYDQTSTSQQGNAVGVDDALARVADHARKVAKARDLGLVDFHRPMNRVTRAQQGKDPAFTMMDSARIHPTALGHQLMTYILLREQGVSPTVASVAIDAAGSNVKTDNCSVEGLNASADGVAFTYTAKALPYPVAEPERVVLDWVPMTKELNQEVFTVRGLSPGKYALSIDGDSVGTWSAKEWAEGVNLAEVQTTPQYKQAAEVMALNAKRRQREQSTLRVFAALEHDALIAKGVDLTDMDAVKVAMDAAIAEEAANKSWRESYFTNLTRAYLAEKPNQAVIEAELADLIEQMYALSQPKPRTVELRRAK